MVRCHYCGHDVPLKASEFTGNLHFLSPFQRFFCPNCNHLRDGPGDEFEAPPNPSQAALDYMEAGAVLCQSKP